MLGLLVSSALMFIPQEAPPAGGPPAAATAPAAAPAAAHAAAPAAAPTGGPAAAAPAKPAAEAPQNPFGSLIVFVPVIVLFYLMILRPQQQQEKKRKEMINQVDRNTRVMTTGGMYGTIVSVDKDANTVLIRLGNDPGVKVEFARSAIAQVIDGGEKDKDK
ncbi:MAG TPA: preprotein translocase subunit YajC, partial [Isosphaeraceae bacterium]